MLSRDALQGWHQQTNQVFMIQISSKINRLAERWAVESNPYEEEKQVASEGRNR